MNTELIENMRKVQSNLEYSKQELINLTNLLNESIKMNDETFKYNDISTIDTKLIDQINDLKYKIIPEIEKSQ